MSSSARGPRLLAIAALSGAAALVYELVFFRELGLLFGVAIHAVAAVVGTFLLGLGIGASRAAWFSRGAAPLRTYARLELFVGLFGIAAPFLFRLVGWILRATQFDRGEAGSPSYVAWTLGFAFVLLIPPTVLMGATFPLLAASQDADPAAPRRRGWLGAVYGANTIGAAIGVLLAAFALLPYVGKVGTTHVAAFLNFVAAFAAYRLSRGNAAESPAAAPQIAPTPARVGLEFPEVLAAFSMGFVALGFQVLGTRVLACLLAATVYAFATALAAYLAGTSIGGAVGAALAPLRTPSRRVIALAMVVFVALMAVGLKHTQLWAGAGDILFGPRNRKPPASFLLYVEHALQGSAWLFLAATAASGVVFTFLMRRVAADARDTADRVGRLFFVNTLGATAGALAAGFVMLPALGLRTSFAWLFYATLACALVVWLAERERSSWLGRLVAVVALAGAGAIVSLSLREPENKEIDADVTTVFAAETAVSSVKVESSPDGVGNAPLLSLVVNGRVEASTGLLDRRLQYLLGFIPSLVHPTPRRVLSIALGTGMSTAAVAMTGPERIDLVELSPAVLDASRFFDAYTARLLDQPIVHVHVDDGRSYLTRSHDLYDLIMADPVHPSTAGSTSLYTREYYELARDHLAPGGMMSQWIPLYELSTSDIGGIVATFRAAFPHLTLWVTAYDLVLLGSLEPIAFDPRQIELRMQREPVRSTLRSIGVRNVDDLLGCCFGAGIVAQRLADASPGFITDNKPWLEFTAPRRLYEYSRDAIALLAQSTEDAPLAPNVTYTAAQSVRAASQRLRDGALSFVENTASGNYSGAVQAYVPVLVPGN